MQLWYRTGNCHHGWHDNNWKTSFFYYSKLQQPWSIWSQTRKKMGGSGVWMQSNCISVKGINVYLDKKKPKQTNKKTWALKFHIKLKGNCMESYHVKNRNIGILHDKQAFTILLHSPKKHDNLYCKSGIYYLREHFLQWLKNNWRIF